MVNVASVAGLYGIPYLGAYGASKAALASFCQSLRAELDGSGISIMIVYPGYTQTEIFRKEADVGGARRPPGPYAPVEEVAEAIVAGMEGEKGDIVLATEGKALRKLVEQRMAVRRDAWLAAIGHKRPGIGKGLPVDEAGKKADELTKQIEERSKS